jgi:hypothetical protein
MRPKNARHRLEANGSPDGDDVSPMAAVIAEVQLILHSRAQELGENNNHITQAHPRERLCSLL